MAVFQCLRGIWGGLHAAAFQSDSKHACRPLGVSSCERESPYLLSYAYRGAISGSIASCRENWPCVYLFVLAQISVSLTDCYA